MNMRTGMAAAVSLGVLGTAGLIIHLQGAEEEPMLRVPVRVGSVALHSDKDGTFSVKVDEPPGTPAVVERRSCSCLSLSIPGDAVDSSGLLRGSVSLKAEREGEAAGRVVLRVGGAHVVLDIEAVVIPPLRTESAGIMLVGNEQGEFNGTGTVISFHSTGREFAKDSGLRVISTLVSGVPGKARVLAGKRVRELRGGAYWMTPIEVTTTSLCPSGALELVAEHPELGSMTLRVPLFVGSTNANVPASHWAVVESDGFTVAAGSTVGEVRSVLVVQGQGDVQTSAIQSSVLGARLLRAQQRFEGSELIRSLRLDVSGVQREVRAPVRVHARDVAALLAR